MAVLPGRRLVTEQPFLPDPLGLTGKTGAWARQIKATLTLYLTDVTFRLNRTLLRDGSVQMTGALKLNVFTEATKPTAAAAGAGAVIFVSDGTDGTLFQGSNGTDWIALDDRLT